MSKSSTASIEFDQYHPDRPERSNGWHLVNLTIEEIEHIHNALLTLGHAEAWHREFTERIGDELRQLRHR